MSRSTFQVYTAEYAVSEGWAEGSNKPVTKQTDTLWRFILDPHLTAVPFFTYSQ